MGLRWLQGHLPWSRVLWHSSHDHLGFCISEWAFHLNLIWCIRGSLKLFVQNDSENSVESVYETLRASCLAWDRRSVNVSQIVTPSQFLSVLLLSVGSRPSEPGPRILWGSPSCRYLQSPPSLHLMKTLMHSSCCVTFLTGPESLFICVLCGLCGVSYLLCLFF